MLNKTMPQMPQGRKRKGFSLVELVVVMAIIGILLVVMAPNYSGFVDKAKTIGIRSDAKTLQTMIELVKVEHTIPGPSTISSLADLTLGDGTDVENLKTFITGLAGTASAGLCDVKVSDLPKIIEDGEIPNP